MLDYGCGLGDDVRLLREQGIAATGWDPVFAANVELSEADVVNLGYVLNVIEAPAERVQTLLKAWTYAKGVLVVAARLKEEGPGGHDVLYNDGYLTRLGTFQKYFEQSELKTLIAQALQETPIAAAPGVFYVFRNAAQREELLSRRQRRDVALPRVRKSDELFEANRQLLEPLMNFVGTNGRLPYPGESDVASINATFGSVKRAFALVRRVTGEGWSAIREVRSQDLLVYLALAHFGGRPPFSSLPRSLQYDVRAFFSTYAAACHSADVHLFAIGKQESVDKLCAVSKIGKQTPSALYVHVSALDRLSIGLRIFEGCARAYMGTVAGVNLVKLHRDKAAVSYLYYPDFDRVAHPALTGSLIVYLQGPAASFRDYSTSENPPILHRKEEFLTEDHPLRGKFAKLTAAEEKHRLYEDPSAIGTKNGWEDMLRRRSVRIQGHRLLKLPGG